MVFQQILFIWLLGGTHTFSFHRTAQQRCYKGFSPPATSPSASVPQSDGDATGARLSKGASDIGNIPSHADATKSPRRQVLASAVRTAFSFAALAAVPSTVFATDEDIITLKRELLSLLRQPSPPPVVGDPGRSARIDVLLDRLCDLNPTPRPGSSASFVPVATGTWRVVFAPHITKLSALAGLMFDPILYKLDTSGSIESNVRYTGPFGVNGWLSTRGGYGSRDESELSFVEWDEIWWNPSASAPSKASVDGAFAPVVTAVGRAGFVSSFADFPVRYLDKDLVVFVFPLSNTRIVAVPHSGDLDPWS